MQPQLFATILLLGGQRGEPDGWMKTQENERQATKMTALERTLNNSAEEGNLPKKEGRKKQVKQ